MFLVWSRASTESVPLGGGHSAVAGALFRGTERTLGWVNGCDRRRREEGHQQAQSGEEESTTHDAQPPCDFGRRAGVGLVELVLRIMRLSVFTAAYRRLTGAGRRSSILERAAFPSFTNGTRSNGLGGSR